MEIAYCPVCGRHLVHSYIKNINPKIEIVMCDICFSLYNKLHVMKIYPIKLQNNNLWLNTNVEEVFDEIERSKKLFHYIESFFALQDKNLILDYGCGRGYLAMLAAIQGYKNVYVCDLDLSVFNRYKDVISKKYPQVDTINQIKGFPVGIKFNYIILWHVLEHVINPLSFLKKISKICNVSCTLAIQTPEFSYKQIIKSHITFFTEKSIKILADKAGFNFKFLNHDVTNSYLTTFIEMTKEQYEVNNFIDCLYKELSKKNNDNNLRLNLINALQKNHEFKKSISQCSNILKKDNENYRAHENISFAYNRIHKFDLAIKHSRLANIYKFNMNEDKINKSTLASLLLQFEKSKYTDKKIIKKSIDYICSTFDFDKIRELQIQYPNFKNTIKDEKYLDIEKFLIRDLKHAILFGLHTVTDKNILDIGSGFGLFSYICKLLGHNVRSLDMHNMHTIYQQSSELFALEKIKHTILPYNPLPKFNIKFDFVICKQVMFNVSTISFEWSPAEWSFFLYDVSLQCNNYFEIFIEWNRHRTNRYQNKKYSDSFYEFLYLYKFIFNEHFAFLNSRDNLPMKSWLENFYFKNIKININNSI